VSKKGRKVTCKKKDKKIAVRTKYLKKNRKWNEKMKKENKKKREI
jgi:hypothetical protein